MTETPKNKRPQAAKPEAHKQKQSSQPSVANELRGARVRASIWHDAAFLRLSPDAQRLFLMLSTMPEEHISGLTTMAPETMGARLRMSPRQVRTRLVELMHAGFVAFDDINSLCPLFWLLRHYETQLGCEPTTDEQGQTLWQALCQWCQTL